MASRCRRKPLGQLNRNNARVGYQKQGLRRKQKAPRKPFYSKMFDQVGLVLLPFRVSCRMSPPVVLMMKI